MMLKEQGAVLLLGLFIVSVCIVACGEFIYDIRQFYRIRKIPKNRKLPFITILLQTQNSSANAVKSVESICRSSYPHYRLIVIDNGSQSSALQQLLSLEQKYDKHLTIVRRKSTRSIQWQTQLKRYEGSGLTVCLSTPYFFRHDSLSIIARNSLALPSAAIYKLPIRLTETRNIFHLIVWFTENIQGKVYKSFGSNKFEFNNEPAFAVKRDWRTNKRIAYIANPYISHISGSIDTLRPYVMLLAILLCGSIALSLMSRNYVVFLASWGFSSSWFLSTVFGANNYSHVQKLLLSRHVFIIYILLPLYYGKFLLQILADLFIKTCKLLRFNGPLIKARGSH